MRPTIKDEKGQVIKPLRTHHPQIMTQNEFADMTNLLVRDHDINQMSEPEFVHKMKKLALPGRFTLQSYIPPKLNARYITSFKDVTNDRLTGLRPNIDFDILASKYHEWYCLLTCITIALVIEWTTTIRESNCRRCICATIRQCSTTQSIRT